MTLTEFLLERIAEDEQHAREYSDDDSPGTWRRFGEDIAAAMRTVVKMHDYTDEWGGNGEEWRCQSGNYVAEPCSTLLALAQPYADHADFQDSWRLEVAPAS